MRTLQRIFSSRARYPAAMKAADTNEVVPASTYPLSTQRFDPPRALAYASLGALSGTLPLPWIPDVVARKVRGTLLHDIASRHGVTLMDEARDVLAEPWLVGGMKSSFLTSVLSQAGRYATRRALTWLGPLGWLPPAQRALYTYILGHTFERYMATVRISRAVRIDVDEAKAIRRTLEQALMAMVTVKADSPWKDRVDAPEELRTDLNRFVDGVVLSLVSLPGWFVERLDAAFDDAWAAGSGTPR